MPQPTQVPPTQARPAEADVGAAEAKAKAPAQSAAPAKADAGVAGVAGMGIAPEKALNQAVSPKTVSAMAGLKPGSAGGSPVASSEWVSQGEVPGPELPGIGAEKGAEKRGEADKALSEKLDLLAASAGQAPRKLPVPNGAQGAGTAAADAPSSTQSAPFGAASASPDQLGAQLMQMGGEIQGAQGGSGKAGLKPAKPLSLAGSGNAALSGGEFLSALDAGKAGLQGLAVPGAGATADRDAAGSGNEGFGAKPSLRVIDGGGKGKGKAGQLGGMAAERGAFEDRLGALTASQSPASFGGQAAAASKPAPEVAGHVVKGANAEDRLSSETLFGVSNGIREFAAQGTGGEMRIRLRPENLGELHVRVVTDGKNVDLQIQASDGHAKKIIEESMSHLKESMASQNLSLGSVDFTVGQAQQGGASGNSSDQSQQQSQSQGSFGQDMLGQQNAGGSSGREGWGGSREPGDGGAGRASRIGASASARGAAQMAASASARAGGTRSASGRLDVRA